MPRATALPIVQPDLVQLYLDHRAAQGMGCAHKERWGARMLLAKVPELEEFRLLPLAEQLAFNHETHRFIGWLALTGRMRPGADYLVARPPRLGMLCVADLRRRHVERYKQWLLELIRRPEGLRSNLLFTDHGRSINASRVEAVVRRAAERAGLGRVTPHQLRHTLATQAINRGMSLEAIAALLGHRSLSMTRVYARIADRTVADEYFAVSERVEALYDAPRMLPADAEGTEMRRLRAEVHRRMLGNGYCARPVEMDCHFESICESCTFFVTTIEFRPTLERQRDDAATKGQIARRHIFDGLLTRLDEQAS